MSEPSLSELVSQDVAKRKAKRALKEKWLPGYKEWAATFALHSDAFNDAFNALMELDRPEPDGQIRSLDREQVSYNPLVRVGAIVRAGKAMREIGLVVPRPHGREVLPSDYCLSLLEIAAAGETPSAVTAALRQFIYDAEVVLHPADWRDVWNMWASWAPGCAFDEQDRDAFPGLFEERPKVDQPTAQIVEAKLPQATPPQVGVAARTGPPFTCAFNRNDFCEPIEGEFERGGITFISEKHISFKGLESSNERPATVLILRAILELVQDKSLPAKIQTRTVGEKIKKPEIGPLGTHLTSVRNALAQIGYPYTVRAKKEGD